MRTRTILMLAIALIGSFAIVSAEGSDAATGLSIDNAYYDTVASGDQDMDVVVILLNQIPGDVQLTITVSDSSHRITQAGPAIFSSKNIAMPATLTSAATYVAVQGEGVNLVAKVQAKITYVIDDQNKVTSYQDLFTEPLDLSVVDPDYTKTGYDFDGWSATKTEQTKVTQVVTSQPLYPMWDEWKLVVSFDANSGTGTMADQTIMYSDASKKLDSNKFSRTGYSFSGWATTPSGSVQYSDKADVSTLIISPDSELDLYAKWRSSEPTPPTPPGPGTTYAVTVEDSEHGSATASKYQSITAGTRITLTANPDAGYEFDSWIVTPSTVVITNNAFTMPSSNVTVKAVFKESSPTPVVMYTIDIENPLNGTIVGDTLVYAGDDADFVIKANDDYIVSDVTVDGVSVGDVNVYIFKNVYANHTITATFEYKKDARTTEDPLDGSITQTFEDSIDGIAVDVTRVTSVDTSSIEVASVEDEGIYAVAEKTTDASGKTASSYSALVTPSSGKVSASQLKSAQDSASAVAEAIGVTGKAKIVIDVESIDEVKLDVTDYDGSSDIVVSNGSVTVTFDKDAIVFYKAISSDLEVIVEEMDKSELTKDQQKLVEGYDVYDISVVAGSTVIKNFNGKAVISLPYQLKTGEKASDVAIYYLSSEAKVEKVGGTYNNGYITATLTHFSLYFAAADYVIPEEGGSDNTMLYIGLAIVVILILIGLAYYFLVVKKRA